MEIFDLTYTWSLSAVEWLDQMHGLIKSIMISACYIQIMTIEKILSDAVLTTTTLGNSSAETKLMDCYERLKQIQYMQILGWLGKLSRTP